jgi:peptidoglycan hydrolase-like protein with peptidoglycan-binding domain
MKRLILTLIVLAGLTVPVLTARPQPAAAANCHALDFVCHIIGGYAPFGEASSCTLSQVWVTGTPTRHTYQYEQQCGSTHFKVSGSYDVASKRVEEKVAAPTDAWQIAAIWTCFTDPWIYEGAPPSCTNIDLRAQGGSMPADGYLDRDFPVSANLLIGQQRRVLNAQLQNSLKTPAASPASSPVPGVGSLSRAQTQSDAAAVQRAVIAWPLLSSGAQGENVRTVQYLLRQHGADVVVDGNFGPQTAAAVRAFNLAQGLHKSGASLGSGRTVMSSTWEKLIVPVQQGSRGEAVRAVQSQLAARGMAVAVDGDFGPQTAQAVTAYQQQRGLAATGVVDALLWSMLVNGK